MTSPTGTAVSPASTWIRSSTPLSTASSSMTALSVSISARISPTLTVSPDCFNHWRILPCVVPAPIAGITTSISMSHSLQVMAKLPVFSI
ncbi:hypothetical protein G6F65_021756 [Rhizopus arrhizus]|nr:hypothetical protein G6F65_021756 [Rhizopus arrhizus]